MVAVSAGQPSLGPVSAALRYYSPIGGRNMGIRRSIVAAAGLVAGTVAVIAAAQGQQQPAPQAPPPDYVATLVGHLDLDKYKGTIKGLTQFGDRREGTQRNRDAVAWIEAQLKSYGCSTVERMQYTPPQRGGGGQRAGSGGGGAAGAVGAGGGATAVGAAGAGGPRCDAE